MMTLLRLNVLEELTSGSKAKGKEGTEREGLNGEQRQGKVNVGGKGKWTVEPSNFGMRNPA